MTTTGTRPQSFTEFRALGSRLRAAGRFMEAAEAYGIAAKMSPGENAGLFMAFCLRDAERNEIALKAFLHYVATHPRDFDGYVGLGMFYRHIGAFGQAVAPLRAALTIREDIPTFNALIGVLIRDGQLAEARAQGMRNLERKHALSLEAFRALSADGAGGTRALAPGGRGFDPEHSERNIIAFSLWGDRPEYVTGAIVNAQIARHMYARWTARFYCDTSVPADARAALQVYGAQVVMMDRPEDARIRPMWRFLAADDPAVNVFICRDTDSRLNPREVLAVSDWLRSGKRFHVMRDHLFHHELILAGMWGGTAGVLPGLAAFLRDAPQYFDNKFADQAFLADFVWPLIQGDVAVHDEIYGFPAAGGFPEGIELPGEIHVGGAIKTMPHWSEYIHMPR